MPNPNQPKKNAKDDLLKALLGSECVRYFPQLAEYVGGAQAALMLSQLLYWRARTDDDKPILKSVDDMQRETGLTPAEQVTARDRLDALKICPSELRGMPRIWHYYPSIDAVAELVGSGVVWRDNPLNTDKRKANRVVLDGDDKKPIERLNHSMEKSGNVVGKNRTILPEKISQLNKELETTEEITKEITFLQPPAAPALPLSEKPEPEPKPKRARSSKQLEQDAEVKAVCEAFSAESGIPMPPKLFTAPSKQDISAWIVQAKGVIHNHNGRSVQAIRDAVIRHKASKSRDGQPLAMRGIRSVLWALPPVSAPPPEVAPVADTRAADGGFYI